MTGSLESFKAMVQNPFHGPMIEHRNASNKNLMVEGESARIDVILKSRDGEYLGYRFPPSRRHGEQYQGSWLTDAVVRFHVVLL